MTDAAIEKNATIFTQAQAQYTTLSTQANKACANCVFFRDTGYDGIDWQHCHLVEAYPEPILPTGYCDEWRAKPEPPPELAETVAEAVGEAVEEAVEAVIEAVPVVQVQAQTPKRRMLVERVKALFTPPAEGDSFNVFKGSNGQWYWIAKHTNAYEDRDGEILSEKAHEGYIKRLDMGLVPMPELWTWHVKGTKHGQADVVFGVGKIVVAVGHFDDTPQAKQAIQFYRKNAGRIKLSHGFTAPQWAFKNGVYEVYNTFEITTLPDGAESNPYTSFEEVKAMQPDAKKLEWVANVLGKEVAARVVSETEQHDKALMDLNVRYKDYADVEAKPDGELEGEPNVAKAFVDLVETQGGIMALVANMDKALQQQIAVNKGLAEELAALKTLVNAPPRRSSEDDSTVLSEDATNEVKESLAQYDKDESAFWGAAVKGN